MNWLVHFGGNRPRIAKAIGLDVVASHDATCWTIADYVGVIEQIVMSTPNTMEIVGHTIRLLNEHKVPVDCVAIDAGGSGKQITDRLHEQDFFVRSIGFGEAADDSQAHKNRRAELYSNLRRLLDAERENGGFLLPPDGAELRQEVAILPLQYDSEGKMFLPPKDPRPNQATHIRLLRQILGRSPDLADSLSLAAWALRQPSSNWDQPLICSGEPGDDEALTPEKIEELPAFLRELVEESNALTRDSVVFGDRWGE